MTNLIPLKGDVSTVLQLSFIFGLLKKETSEPFRTHTAWTWGAVNLTNLILTSFSLLIEPLASPRFAEGR